MNIRQIQESDAASFLVMQHQLDEQSPYMLYTPGERQTTVSQTQKRIQGVNEAGDLLLVVFDEDNHALGYLQAVRGGTEKIRHSAYIVVGLLHQIQRQGIGTQLFQKLERWARHEQIRRLELTVITQNEGGVRLYQKAGFEIEGTKKQAIYQNGCYLDEYYMAKLLDLMV